MEKINFEKLNNTVRYVMFSVFKIDQGKLPDERENVLKNTSNFFNTLDDVVVRGIYDISGLRADADYLIWWHSEKIETLQDAYNLFRRTDLGKVSLPVWSSVALHRPAEFNKSHLPAFLKGEEPGKYVCVYPFVRSYEWYLLPDEERRSMLAEHGIAAREYQDVRANTISSFALNDYEWILAFEAPELHRIVDLMRHLRNTEARMHVREEIPFFTGTRIELEDLINKLP